ncbi:MAG: redoxin domain-containing protein [Chloroflexi bacterium]|nr:redoxin domain-containing protein [Chloroflexota bacterium]
MRVKMGAGGELGSGWRALPCLVSALLTLLAACGAVPGEQPGTTAQSSRTATTEPVSTPQAAAATTTPAQALAGPIAPPVESDTWVNVPAPLAWASLRGNVVMVEFWTFGCINCQHVIPSLREMYADYKELGFTIIGVHSPEFDYEKKLENVKEAVADAGIQYPVAIDNDFTNWRRYKNLYWPALYLVDKNGVIRYTHVGEGGYAETRQWIERLLAE